MAQMFGYAGTTLRVDLSTRTTTREELSDDVARRFLGGAGLGARILYAELEAGIDPLSPATKLVFATGPFTATRVPCNGRTTVMAKSPLTGIWGESSMGGFFATELKLAGYDALVVEGKADQPVYLWIRDDKIEIRDATALWGTTVDEAHSALHGEIGEPKARIVCVGPGGEACVKYASLVADLSYAAGRTGMGAVMGSKNLKAIALRGTGSIAVADEEGLRKAAAQLSKILGTDASTQTLSQYGTWNSVAPLQAIGLLPTENFKKGTFEQADRIDGPALERDLLKKKATCYRCPIACRNVCEAEGLDGTLGGPQYETVAALGSLCRVGDPAAIARLHELCNKYTLDTISTGGTIAFAIESFEKGLLSAADTDGLTLRWGDPETMATLIKKIAFREGVGDLLAEGVRGMAKRLGAESEAQVLHVKGMEMPMHDPRGKKGFGLSVATSNRGACHIRSFHDQSLESPNAAPELGLTEPMDAVSIEGKGEATARIQDFFNLAESLVICKFPLIPPRPITPSVVASMLRLVTGWDVDIPELLVIGGRINTLCRCFNAREGITRADDRLPPRIAEPLPDGLYAGQSVSEGEMNTMLDEYYAYRGWNRETGNPEASTLKRLGLADIVK